MRRRDIVVIAFVIAAATLAAQPLDRLTGKVLDAAGQPLKDADVRVEAIFGFATKDKDERGYLSAAINVLSEAHNVMRGTC